MPGSLTFALALRLRRRITRNFVGRKSRRAFSGLAIDQGHKQHNAMVKGPAGAIGITQDPGSLRRFTMAGPEVAFPLSRFEASEPLSQLMKHHEEYPAFQKSFLEHCVAMKESFSHFGNPFLEHGTELLAEDTCVATISKAVDTLYSMENLGKDMYATFIKERFVEGPQTVRSTIKKLKLQISEAKEKKPSDVSNLKSKIKLFSRLFTVPRERDLNLDTFFEHENQKCPPAISASGKLRTGSKSDLMEKLESLFTTESVFNNSCDVVIYDGAALVQMVRPKNSKTFEEYYLLDLKPCVVSNARNSNCSRIDIVWDLYLPESLKAQERDSRGVGVRRNVVPNGSFPKDWSDFLRNDRNKTDVFQYLGRRFIGDFPDKNVVTNLGESVHTSSSACTALEGKTIHMEEADGRIFWHVKDAVDHGAKVVLIRSSDTDVFVIDISVFHELKSSGLQELWLLTGVGAKRRYISMHHVAEMLEEKSVALRGFHAYTGCDTTGFFAGKGKKSCFNAWLQNPEVTPAFLALSKPSEELNDTTYNLLESFVCRLYDPRTESCKTAEVRRDLFSTKNRLVQFIPPAPSTLRQKAQCIKLAMCGALP
ncbi:Malate dehydrogenase [Frankliniella fusca]|uniref:Malate dehydrogenase n=1 Tax=Frankliniella fusca TaxID=407009 RepID=A0AAE1LJ69_9NEOP|nr:Malate dehydrogenase [Frankliniella fusca]